VKEKKERAKQETEGHEPEYFEGRLLPLPSGPLSVRFSPLLVVAESRADSVLGVSAEALSEVGGRSR
jgi:hypothetical protein